MENFEKAMFKQVVAYCENLPVSEKVKIARAILTETVDLAETVTIKQFYSRERQRLAAAFRLLVKYWGTSEFDAFSAKDKQKDKQLVKLHRLLLESSSCIGYRRQAIVFGTICLLECAFDASKLNLPLALYHLASARMFFETKKTKTNFSLKNKSFLMYVNHFLQLEI